MKTNTLTRNGTALAVLALLAAAPAAAQTAASAGVPSAAQSAVGRWLYDANGDIVGSVHALQDGGRIAVVQYGTIRTPGNKLVAIPAEDVAVIGGRATLRSMTADAVRSRPAAD